jgi:hypothetical protein
MARVKNCVPALYDTLATAEPLLLFLFPLYQLHQGRYAQQILLRILFTVPTRYGYRVWIVGSERRIKIIAQAKKKKTQA